MLVNGATVLEAVRDLIGVAETRFGVVRERTPGGVEVIHGHSVCQSTLTAPHPRAGGVLISDVGTLEDVLHTSCNVCAELCAQPEWLCAVLGPVVRVAEAVRCDTGDEARLWGRALRTMVVNPRGNVSLEGMRSLLALAPITSSTGRLAMVRRASVHERDGVLLARGAWHAIESPVSLVWVEPGELPEPFVELSVDADAAQVSEFAALWGCYRMNYETRDVREVWELSRAVSAR